MKLSIALSLALSTLSSMGWVQAQTLPPTFLSDRLLINDASGKVLFDKSLIEQAGLSESLIYNPPIPVDSCVLTTACNAVALVEPLNEPIAANETPVYVQTPIGRRIVSDYILSFSVGEQPRCRAGLRRRSRLAVFGLVAAALQGDLH